MKHYNKPVKEKTLIALEDIFFFEEYYFRDLIRLISCFHLNPSNISFKNSISTHYHVKQLCIYISVFIPILLEAHNRLLTLKCYIKAKL